MSSLSTNFLIKEAKLFNYFKNELTENHIWITGKSKVFLLLTLLSILSILVGAFGQLMGMEINSVSLFITLGVILSFVFTRISDYLSINYALIHYPDYSPLLKKSFFKRTNKQNFLRAYRSDKLNDKLLEPDFQNIDIDTLIEYYKNSSNSLTAKKWWPVTLTAVIAFPVWSESVAVLISSGSRIEEKMAMALALLVVSFSITFLISSVKTALESILLMHSIELSEMAKLLELIKIARLNSINNPT
ncbi:hypothetical protein H70357_13225 [Paenibacillus sp. FSL H7-0357]|nr:hypothetical protein [Paenibacillus sp. FSL H7-0357]AIQ17514.1 hypothetical protein H70357_13225 [Paenibacillus sp. FSL H7-0357]